MLNKSEIYMKNANNETNNNYNMINYDNNFSFSNNDYSEILKDIPCLSNLELLYNEIKSQMDLYIQNYEKLKTAFNYKINNYNSTIKNMNNNIFELNKKLALEKEQNNLITNQNQNKIYEINKNISDLNENNYKISTKFKMLKDFINNFYINILNNYNNISSKINSKGKFLLSQKNIKKYKENNFDSINEDHENNIKEVLIEAERIFNNLIEYIMYLEEELNNLENLEKNNSRINSEKMEMAKNLNKLNNEINKMKIDNQNQNNNLKIQFELNLKEQIKEIESKNNEIIRQLNEQMKKKDEEVINVNKNYNLLYNQYKLLMRSNSSTE